MGPDWDVRHISGDDEGYVLDSGTFRYVGSHTRVGSCLALQLRWIGCFCFHYWLGYTCEASSPRSRGPCFVGFVLEMLKN